MIATTARTTRTISLVSIAFSPVSLRCPKLHG
jgi:hypothetical protein